MNPFPHSPPLRHPEEAVTHATVAAIWVALSAIGWPAFVYVTARISARRAQRRADRAVWDQLRREERRICRKFFRRPATKPSPIAIRFHALTDDCAVERLLSRLHPIGARPSPEGE